MLHNRTILLAGGSGGLGSASAESLAKEGARVIVSYKADRERAAKLGVETMQADITIAADRSRLLDAAAGLYGLVVFTGIPSRSTGEQAMRTSLETNYLGPILLAREAAERMKAAGTPGAIVLFSTMQALSLFAGSTSYAAPKAALIHAAQILAKECRGPANIRVNVICPGVNQAGMAEASIAAGKYEGYLKGNIIPRYGRATDVARAVRFFLEPDNYITGQVLTVDGGLTL